MYFNNPTRPPVPFQVASPIQLTDFCIEENSNLGTFTAQAYHFNQTDLEKKGFGRMECCKTKRNKRKCAFSCLVNVVVIILLYFSCLERSDEKTPTMSKSEYDRFSDSLVTWNKDVCRKETGTVAGKGNPHSHQTYFHTIYCAFFPSSRLLIAIVCPQVYLP